MKSLFITGLAILIIFNFIYCTMNPDIVNVMYVGAITGLIASVVATTVISGINILGSGLTGESIRIIFSISTILNLLFQISIAGIQVGIGLVNNILIIFDSTMFAGIGYFIASTLAIMTLVSGMLMIVGGSD